MSAEQSLRFVHRAKATGQQRVRVGSPTFSPPFEPFFVLPTQTRRVRENGRNESDRPRRDGGVEHEQWFLRVVLRIVFFVARLCAMVPIVF